MRIRYLAPGIFCFCTSPTHALKAPSCCADVGKGQSPPVRRSTFSYHISDRGYCAPNTDYQWSTTRPVKGEALSDERFAGEFANTIMQLARTVSLPNFRSFLDITASLMHVLLYEIKDKSVDSALWHVRCFLAPPTTLMRPSVLWKAALFKVKEALGSAARR